MKKYVIQNESFELEEKYSDINLVGKGGYGSVISAFDCCRKAKVAIKKISNIFGDDHNIKAKRTLREIQLLRHFNKHSNVVSIYDLMIKRTTTKDIEDVYVVLELYDSDLDQIISSPQPLDDSHCKYFMYQILRGLKYLVSDTIMMPISKESSLLMFNTSTLQMLFIEI